MKHFLLYLKSHEVGVPDWEDEVDAETKEEAVQAFLKRLNQHSGGEWSADQIWDDVCEECIECGGLNGEHQTDCQAVL